MMVTMRSAVIYRDRSSTAKWFFTTSIRTPRVSSSSWRREGHAAAAAAALITVSVHGAVVPRAPWLHLSAVWEIALWSTRTRRLLSDDARSQGNSDKCHTGSVNSEKCCPWNKGGAPTLFLEVDLDKLGSVGDRKSCWKFCDNFVPTEPPAFSLVSVVMLSTITEKKKTYYSGSGFMHRSDVWPRNKRPVTVSHRPLSRRR